MMAFFNHLVKDEMDENASGRMEQQSPNPMSGQINLGMGHNSQSVAGPLQNLPLAPISSNNNNSLIPVGHRRLEMDTSLEPVQRGRSNTWPVTCPEYVESEEGPDPNSVPQDQGSHTPNAGATEATPKKNTSRRNPWGNLSYADLIAKAITSSSDQRSTLSQIYDWMVQNIAYFKDKGDSNSSAGWKNSIRHNLSLHNRFMRVQNEGTGKSSWWVLNPDAKPGKSTRRRANTMEGGARYEKKRGRVKKKIEGQLPMSPAVNNWNGGDYWSQQHHQHQQAQLPGQHIHQDHFPDQLVDKVGNNLGNTLSLGGGEAGWANARAATAAAAAAAVAAVATAADQQTNSSPSDCLKASNNQQVPPIQMHNLHLHQHHHLHNHQMQINGLIPPHHGHPQMMQHNYMYDDNQQRYMQTLNSGGGGGGGGQHHHHHHHHHPHHQLAPHHQGGPPHFPGHHPLHHHTGTHNPHMRAIFHGTPLGGAEKMPTNTTQASAPHQISSMQAMSPAHSNHSLSPTQPLGPISDSDIRSHPFPTPPNSLPQHHHSPSNSATPHTMPPSGLHSDYLHGGPLHNGSTNQQGASTAGAAEGPNHHHHNGNVADTNMLRSALTQDLSRTGLSQDLSRASLSQDLTRPGLSQDLHRTTATHTGSHHGSGHLPPLPPQQPPEDDDRTADYEDIDDINNVVPIGSEDFGTNLCEVVKKYGMDTHQDIFLNGPSNQGQVFSPMSTSQSNDASSSPTTPGPHDSSHSLWSPHNPSNSGQQ